MKLSKEDISEMIRLVKEEGESVSKVAERFGVRVQTVYYHLNKVQPTKIKSESKRHQIALERRRKAIELHRKGISIKEISKILGVKEVTVRHYLHGSISERGRKRKITENDISVIRNLAIVGHTLDDIARLYRVNKNTIKRVLKEYHKKNPDDNIIKLLVMSGKGKGKLKNKIIDLYIKGKNNIEIARELGVNLFIVNKVLKTLKDNE